MNGGSMKNWERIRARLARDCGVALTRGGGQAKTGGTWGGGQGTYTGETWGHTNTQGGTWGQGTHRET